MYVKRGAAKKERNTLMVEAVEAIKTILQQPLPTSETDSITYFGNFIASRLHEMEPVTRKRCENDIMQCLTNY